MAHPVLSSRSRSARCGAFAIAAAAFTCVVPSLAAQGFGAHVAVAESGEVLIVETGARNTPGGIWIYARDGDGWGERGVLRLEGVDEDDGFGSAFAADAERMVVAGDEALHLFERGESGWISAGRIPVDVEVSGNASALLSGEFLFFHPGVSFSRGGPGEPGAVLVFRQGSNGSWTPSGELTAAGSAAGDRFGAAMTRAGDLLAVSAPGASVGGEADAGEVRLFARGADGTWSEAEDPLTLRGGPVDAFFGATLLASETEDGTTLFVGAPGLAGIGAVYAFERDGDGSWSHRGTLLPPVAASMRAQFGRSLALVEGELWVGASVDGRRAGEVYRYAREGEGWGLRGSLAASEPVRNAGFGSDIAVGPGVAVVAAGSKDYGWGTAYIFERGDGGWSERAEVWSEPEGYAEVTGGEIGCEEGSAGEFECARVDMLSFLPVRSLGGGRGVRVNDVWGWTDPATGREYALVGMTDQTSFVDITDPARPRYLGRLPMPETANGSTWRDIKVYQDHAFIVSDGAGEHGMQVFDLVRLRDVGREPVTFEEDALYHGIASAHNIVINEESGFAYSVGSSGGAQTCGGGLHMIDIRTPERPTFAGCFADTRTGRGRGYSHDAMCIDYHGPDAEHAGKEVCFGLNADAVSIADVSDKENPVPIAVATYPNRGYTHQGWITEDHRYFYVNDELDEIQDGRDGTQDMSGTRTLVWDVSDLDDPILVTEHYGEVFSSDHNLYVRGRYMYQSNYQSGLRILDIADPEDPREVAFFDTVPYADGSGFGGSWSNYPFFESGTIIVTSGNEGLFMLRHREPELVP